MSKKQHNQRQQQQRHHHHQEGSEDHCMSTDPVPVPEPIPGTPPVTDPGPPPAQPPTDQTSDAATAIAAVKTDLHQAAEDARSAWWKVSAGARADLQKIIHDVEAAEGVSLASLKKILNF